MRLLFGLALIFFSACMFYLVLTAPSQQTSEEPTAKVIAPPVAPKAPSVKTERVSMGAQTPQQTFRQELKEMLPSLPTLDARKQTGNPEIDYHRSPMELYEVAPVMAEVRDKAEAHPELATEAMWFFDQCAKKPKILAAVGSVCLHHLRVLSQRTNTSVDFASYPTSLVRLSEKLSFAE